MLEVQVMCASRNGNGMEESFIHPNCGNGLCLTNTVLFATESCSTWLCLDEQPLLFSFQETDSKNRSIPINSFHFIPLIPQNCANIARNSSRY
mmetsp:Transcript_3924/g.11126  ORF Transcript_3924/g.11126 Transcript_3924/m.11126 type:complete len:93 (+) Transcript_3924:836-1114(+)